MYVTQGAVLYIGQPDDHSTHAAPRPPNQQSLLELILYFWLDGSVFEADCMLAVAGNRMLAVDGNCKPDAMYGPVDTSSGGGGGGDV